MITPLEGRSSAKDPGWRRVSSFKPQIVAILLAVIAMGTLILLLDGRAEALPLAAAGMAVGLGVVALTCKVVHKRGNDYRVSTLFYVAVVTVDDVCMTVTRPGPLWSWFRIHLRRPARFGWTISFVPMEEGGDSATKAAKPTEA